METRYRAIGLGVACLVLAGVMAMTPKVVIDPGKTEAWMEKNLPPSVGKLTFIPSSENPQQTYRMDKPTYEALHPFGIVSRKYTDGEREFDVVIIASNSKDSFHDPTSCFNSQGWKLKSQDTTAVTTKSYGTIHGTLVKMDNGNTGSKDNLAFFVYKGPAGIAANTPVLKLEMFWERAKGNPHQDAVFYRFIPDTPNITKDELLAFVGKYMDAANQTSGGYF